MARNTQIENPTRVAIATVEDQNKYQISRNRNIDNINQVFDNNVAADVKPAGESNLFKLAEALSKNSSVIEDFVNRRVEEQNKLDLEMGKKDALENPVASYTEAQKLTLEKSKAYHQGYMTIFAYNSKAKDSVELPEAFNMLPEDERLQTNVTDWMAKKIKEKNAGITDPIFNSVYNDGMAQTIAEANKKSIIEKHTKAKERNHSLIKEYIVNNNGNFLDNIESYEQVKKGFTSTMPISNKELDDIVFAVAEEKQNSGDIKDLRYLEKLKKLVNSNPKSSDGVPIFGKYANTGAVDKMVLTSVKSIAEKKRLEETLEDQRFKDENNKSINNIFLKAREGKTKEALKELDVIIKSNLDTLDLQEVKTYYSIISDAHNEVLSNQKQNKNLLKPDKVAGSGSGGSGSKVHPDFVILKMAASNGELNTKQLENLFKEGKLKHLNPKDVMVVFDRARNFENGVMTKVENENEDEEKAGVVNSKKIKDKARDIVGKSLFIPKPQHSKIGYNSDTQILLKSKFVEKQEIVLNAVNKGITEGKIKTEADVLPYVTPILNEANKEIAKMPYIKTKYKTEKEYMAYVKEQHKKGIKISEEVIDANLQYHKNK